MTKKTVKALAKGRSDLFKIPPGDIVVVEGFNTRNMTPKLREHLDELKASILENGVLEPLTVGHNKPLDRLELRHGHCRLTAVRELMEEGKLVPVDDEPITVPCINEGQYTSEAESVAQIATRNDGLPLETIERAEVYKRLFTVYSWNEAKIAKKMGRSVAHVKQLLELTAAPEPVQQAVRSGGVSATLASQTMREHGTDAPAVIDRAVKKAASEGKTRATARHVDPGPGYPRTKENFAFCIDALEAISQGRGGPAREVAKRCLAELALDPKARKSQGIEGAHERSPDTPASPVLADKQAGAAGETLPTVSPPVSPAEESPAETDPSPAAGEVEQGGDGPPPIPPVVDPASHAEQATAESAERLEEPATRDHAINEADEGTALREPEKLSELADRPAVAAPDPVMPDFLKRPKPGASEAAQ